jgi:anti-sigma factor RsiW
MHQQIRQSLENYLRGGDLQAGPELPAEFEAHLGECAACADEVRTFQEHSRMLRWLSSSAEVEPRSGFYARVVERIQAQPTSIWSVFLDRRFGFRLAVASAAVVAVLGAYLVTSEMYGPEFTSSRTMISTDTPRASEASFSEEDGPRLQQQQRNAVLVDLASYRQ